MRFRPLELWVLGLVLSSQPVHAQIASVPTAAPASAPASVSLSLAQAIERFRRLNLQLEASKYEISAARADVIAAGLLPNPRLSFDGAFRVHGDSAGADRQYEVRLAQSLPLWGRLGASQAAAELTVSATEREFAALAWELLGDVRRAYLALQLAEDRSRVLAAGLSDLEGVQRVLEARAAAGANPVYDRVRLDVERGSLRARISGSTAEVTRARGELASAIGGPLEAQPLSASEPLAEPQSQTIESASLVRRAVERRHEIAASRFRAGAAEARVRAVRKRYLPEPELGVGYARWSGIVGLPSGAVGGAVLASASIPLPLFDRGQGSVDRELSQSRAARVRERDVKLSIEREVTLAASQLELATRAYLTFRAETAQNAASVRHIAEVTYREGRGTILELLDAYSSYLRVEEQALELRGAALAAAVELEQALGSNQ